MLSTLLAGGAPSQQPDTAQMTRAESIVSVSSDATIDDPDVIHAPSSSSTPPTSVGDSHSVSSTSPKLEVPLPIASSSESSNRRSVRSSRASIATYNVKVLTGTAIHAPRKYCKNKDALPPPARRRTVGGSAGGVSLLESIQMISRAIDNNGFPAQSSEHSKSADGQPKDATRRQTIGGDAMGSASEESLGPVTRELVTERVAKLDMQWSVPVVEIQVAPDNNTTKLTEKSPKPSPKKTAKEVKDNRRISTRSIGEKSESLTKRLSSLGKRKFDDGLTRGERELKRLQDTNEFAKIDTKPVVHEVWSNGKLVVPERVNRRKKATEEPVPSKTQKEELVKPAKPELPKVKVWLDRGRYAGQGENDFNKTPSNIAPLKKEEAYKVAPYQPKGNLPMPMGMGQKLLLDGRDFKLPFDVCSPLPPGQPKPTGWGKTSKNRFIGEARALWERSTLFDSFSSKCVCTPAGGCDVDCQNRIMLYECNDENCNAGAANCTNRAFATLKERRKQGNKYTIGVEVIKTADRGYGVRSNRCFEANQIIVEYTGEIITEDECDRRMNEDYKDNDCYYLMSFDQNMIIDATKGSIARFVNHSCKPNSKMVKWIVGGIPRMALFAGDNPIFTGDELTYDYNFDPFSAKNVQECRCGSDNCRGVLGPKPKDAKPIKETIKDTIKATVKAGKRKLKELLGGEEDSDAQSPKRRKIKPAKGLKRSVSSATSRTGSGVKAVRRAVSAQFLNAREAVTSKRPRTAGGENTLKQTKLSSSKNSTLTLVPADSPAARTQASPKSSPKKNGSVTKNVVRDIRGRRVARDSTIRIISGAVDGDETEEEGQVH